jgi:hypothetical protein
MVGVGQIYNVVGLSEASDGVNPFARAVLGAEE